MKRIIPAVLISGLMALAPHLIAQVTETPTEPTKKPTAEPTTEATTTPMKESTPEPAKEATKEESKAPTKPKSAANPAILTPRDIKWSEGGEGLPAGVKVATLEGDPKTKGPFTRRIEAPNGYKVPPHTHPTTEHITVISGTFYLGMGDKFDEKAGQKLPAGSFVVVPAHAKHFSWVKGKTVLQIHGNGPWEINYLNPADDPRHMSTPAKEKPAVKK